MMRMSHESTEQRERLVLRARSAYLLFGLVAIIVVAMAVDGFARGATSQTLLVLPWLVAILWFVYLVLLRPCVVVDTNGLTVVNIVRRHRIPWPRLSTVSSRYQLTFTLDDGRTVSSWGAPAGVRRSRERPTATAGARNALEAMRARWSPGAADAPARSTWEWWPIVVSAVVVAACVWAAVATR